MVAVGEQRTHGSRKNALRRVAATLRPCRRNRKNAANFLPQPPDKFLRRDQHFLPRRQRLQLHLRPFIPDEHRPARTQLLGYLKSAKTEVADRRPIHLKINPTSLPKSVTHVLGRKCYPCARTHKIVSPTFTAASGKSVRCPASRSRCTSASAPMAIGGSPARSANTMVAVGEQRTHGSRKKRAAPRSGDTPLLPTESKECCESPTPVGPKVPPARPALPLASPASSASPAAIHPRRAPPSAHPVARRLKLFPHLHRRERKVRALSRLAQPLYQRQRTDTNRRTPGA